MSATVIAVSQRRSHGFSKTPQMSIRLLAGLGVEGDAHCGATVQHVYDRLKNPDAPNRRQVHLLHDELFDELRAAGFIVQPGQLGENITTGGLDLLGLPTGSRLHLGAAAVIELTGLRSPCAQIDKFQPGLRAAVLGRDAEGRVVRKSGVMAIVISGGEVYPGDPIQVALPEGEWRALECV